MTGGIGGSDARNQLAELGPWLDRALPISSDERMTRLAKARELLEASGSDALLIGAGPSLRYFSGVSWSPTERLVGMLVAAKGPPVIICPAFELGSLEAELALPNAEVRLWEEHESPSELVAQWLKDTGSSRLAIDPQLAFFFVEQIRKAAPFVDLVTASPIVDTCRMRKSASELALMQQAKNMTLEVQRRAARILREGITATEVRQFIDSAHRKLGAAGSSFCIVQFGASTAFPHGLPGESRLTEGDLVLIDTGCIVEGYHSDITRTYVFGEPTEEQRTIWALEREAQQAAFDAVAPGVECEVVDAAARKVLERAGLGPDYRLPGLPHRTGHGIGLSIHEPAYLVRGDRTPLAAGMCFSNEPMIVVPDRFGIRLEDHFYVTEQGAAWFTKPSSAIDAPFD